MGKQIDEIVPAPKKFYIPEDKIMQLYELVDADDKNTGMVSHYRLWKFIHEVLPDLEPDKNYHLNDGDILKPCITEIPTEDFDDEDF